MKRNEVLEAARCCVSGDRESDYGSPENNFARIGKFWSAYLSYPVSAKAVPAAPGATQDCTHCIWPCEI